jgi:ditrans,polycis-polyprenyl diphosphate synthase
MRACCSRAQRSEGEVGALMSLAEAKLGELLDNAPALARHRARVRVLGDLGLLPPRVARAAARCAAATATHTGPRVNICLAYTGRDDLAAAAAAVAAGVREGHLRREDVSEARQRDCGALRCILSPCLRGLRLR